MSRSAKVRCAVRSRTSRSEIGAPEYSGSSASGLSASAHVLRGDPKAVLVQVCRESEIDCLFVGARGLTGVERFLLGSVSTSVAMHAPCSVEVVHAPACRNRDGHAEPEASRT